MEAPNRLEQRRMQTRQQLLDAAERVFSELGYTSASILDITEAADVSKRTFYLHFKDKDDLIKHLAYRRFEEVRLSVEEHKTEAGVLSDPRDVHRQMVRTIFEYVQSNPELMQIVVGSDGSFKLNAMAREYVAQAMETGFTNMQFCRPRSDAPVPLNVMAHAVGGAIFQLMCWWVRTESTLTPEEMADLSVSIFFDGIGQNLEMITQEEAYSDDR
jgi:AcrR family transcriptional regulator